MRREAEGGKKQEKNPKNGVEKKRVRQEKLWQADHSKVAKIGNEQKRETKTSQNELE